ncbi:MAG: 6-bladed beta-propeller, partial [Candidatus Aminicenantaceae bacterium]
MKRPVFMVLVLLLLVIQIIFFSCRSHKDGWEGEVEEVDGVTIVRNPLEPYYGELAIELEVDLEIGNDEDPNYQFYSVAGIALDSEQNIYVLDSGNHRVQKFDKDGHYLLTIGREGEGPGEFLRLSSVFIDDQDTVSLSDRRRIQIFDGVGVYKDSLTFENNINDFFLDMDGNIFTFIMQSDDEGSKKYLVKYDRKGK